MSTGECNSARGRTPFTMRRLDDDENINDPSSSLFSSSSSRLRQGRPKFLLATPPSAPQCLGATDNASAGEIMASLPLPSSSSALGAHPNGSFGFYVFALLDPILRELLASIEVLTELDDSVAAAATASGEPIDYDKEEKSVLSHLRNQARLLATLGDALASFNDSSSGGGGTRSGNSGGGGGRSTTTSNMTRVATALGLVVMSEYVLLPIFVTLQRWYQQVQRRNPSISSERDDRERRRRYVIRRSAEYACMEEASRALTAFSDCILRGGSRTEPATSSAESSSSPANDFYEDDGVNDNDDGRCDSVTTQEARGNGPLEEDEGKNPLPLPPLKPGAIVRCLVSCAMALSSLECGGGSVGPHEGTNGDVGTRTASTPPSHCKLDDDEALDRGEECASSLLRCVRSLVGPPPPAAGTGFKRDANPYVDGIVTAMDGALVAQLVQGCLAVLVPPPCAADAAAERSPGADRRNREGKAKDGRGNVPLRLEALEALRALMEGIPSADAWKSLLPGCFADLFRLSLSQLRFSSAQSSPRVASESLLALSRLMSLAFSKMPSDKGTPPGSYEMEWAAASLVAAAAVAKSSDKNGHGLQSPTQKFIAEANARLPAPLSVLLHLLTSHKSSFVRKSGTVLGRTILVDAHGVWTEENLEDLGSTAMECCLTLLQDNRSSVASSALRALQSYRSRMGSIRWKELQSGIFVPRIIQLVEELPALARSGREVELRSRIDLVSGYLLVSFEKTINPSSPYEPKPWKGSTLGASLGCESVLQVLKERLAETLAVDVDSIASSPRIAPDIVLMRGMADAHIGENRYRFLYLRDKSITSAKTMVHLLSSTLGMKRCALFLDSCIADMFDACIVASKDGSSFTGRGHVSWQNKWSGCCVLANEILIGATRPVIDSASVVLGVAIQRGVSPDEVGILSYERKACKIFSSLASSVFPVICNAPLWSLPTSFDSFVDNSHPHHGAPLQKLSVARQLLIENPVGGGILMSALNGNAILVSILMDIIGNISEAIGSNTASNLPTILYPLLEKTSNSNHSHIQHAALGTLEKVSRSTGSPTVSDLLRENFDYLMAVTAAQLQSSRKSMKMVSEMDRSHFPRSLPGVVEILLRCAALQDAQNAAMCTKRCDKWRRDRAFLRDTINALVAMLDLAVPTGQADQAMSLGVIRVFNAALHYLKISEFENTSSFSVRSQSSDSEESKEPWLDLLLQFELNLPSPSCGENNRGGMVPEVGFAQCINSEASGDCTENTETQSTLDTKEMNQDQATQSSSVAVEEVDMVKSILSRGCFFLSSLDIKIQTISCDTILSGCEFLALVQRQNGGQAVPSETIENPLLSTISEVWPSIRARLLSTATMLRNRVGLMTANPPIRRLMSSEKKHDERPQLELEIFLSKLLGIISCLCELSGGFMVDRFEHDVYPALAQLLGSYVHRNQCGREPRASNVNNNRLITNNFTQEPAQEIRVVGKGSRRENVALHSILSCLSKVFSTKELSKGVSMLIPNIGTIILPLLADEGSVGDDTMATLKCMLAVDSDTLWRALINLNLKPVPRRPLKPAKKTVASIVSQNPPQSLMERRAAELFDYAEKLPEQVLVH